MASFNVSLFLAYLLMLVPVLAALTAPLNSVHLSATGSSAWSGDCSSGCTETSPCLVPSASVNLTQSCTLVLDGISVAEISVELQGSIELNITGTGSMNADGHWYFNNPTLDATVSLSDLDLTIGGFFYLEGIHIVIENSQLHMGGSASTIIRNMDTALFRNATMEQLVYSSFSPVQIQDSFGKNATTVFEDSHLVSGASGAGAVSAPENHTVSFYNSEISAYVLLSMLCPSYFNLYDTNVTFVGGYPFSPVVSCSTPAVRHFAAVRTSFNNTLLSYQMFYEYQQFVERLTLNSTRFEKMAIGKSYASKIEIFDSTLYGETNYVSTLYSTPGVDSTVEIVNTFINATASATAPLQIMGPTTGGEYTYARLEKLTWAEPPSPSVTNVYFEGRIWLTTPATIPTVAGHTSTGFNVSGESLEITTALCCSTASVTFTSPLTLHSIEVPSTPIFGTDLSYVPSNPLTGIVTTQGSAPFRFSGGIYIDWRMSEVPVIDYMYPIVYDLDAAMGLLENPLFNVTLHPGSTSQVYNFSFNQVPCDSDCDPAHLVAGPICVSRVRCPCLSSWGGPLCVCDTTSLPPNATCSDAGGQVWELPSDYSLDEDSTFEVPDNYTLVVQGDAVLNGTLNLVGRAAFKTLGTLTQYGTIIGICTLQEMHTPQGCFVYSTISVESTDISLGSAASIQLVFDVSELSTDGSCVQPQSLDSFLNSTFRSLGSTITSDSASWNISFIVPPGLRRDSLATAQTASNIKANISLLSTKGSGSQGTTNQLLATTVASDSCSTFTSRPGMLSLFIGSCPPNGHPKPKGTVKWWYYGIPIIAVLVIVAVTVVLVITVKPVRLAVMPFTGSN